MKGSRTLAIGTALIPGGLGCLGMDIVKDGLPNAVVVIPEDAPQNVRCAADEFRTRGSAPRFAVRGVHCQVNTDLFFQWMAFNFQNCRLQNPPGDGAIGEMQRRLVEPFFISHSWAFWATRQALNEHLDWNPRLDGKRTPPELDGPPWWANSQLCIGNPELREFAGKATR